MSGVPNYTAVTSSSNHQVQADKSTEEVNKIQKFWHTGSNILLMGLPCLESRYTWQNIGRIYNTTEILRDGQVSELPIEIDPKIGDIKWVNHKAGNKVETVQEHLDNYPVDALVVVKHGKVIYERFNTMRPCDKHVTWSVSKVMGSTVMAILEQQGKIDVKKPVSFYLEELKGSEWDGTTVEEMLDMSNGLDSTEHDEGVQDTRSNPERVYYQWGVTIGIFPDAGNMKTHDVWEILRGMKRKYPGHQKFEYNSINTFVMNRINERIGGKPVSALVSELIWSKIGAEHDVTVGIDPTGNPLLFGFTGITCRDLARFGMLFTPSWNKLSAERIVPQAVVDTIQQATYKEMWDKAYVGQLLLSRFTEDKPGTIHNRYQWDAVFEDGDFLKSGVGGQVLYVSPSTDTVICCFCTSYGDNCEEAMARAITKALA